MKLRRSKVSKLKACALIVAWLSTLCITALAQESDSQLAVLKLSWEKVRIRPPASRSSLASQDELIQEARRQQQLADARNAKKRGDVARLERQIQTHEQAKVKALENELPRDGYRYKVTIKNNGSLTVKSVDWDYIFLDQTTEQELARHQFTSDETIKSGKSKEVSVLYLRPPVQALPAEALRNLKKMSNLEQRVEIVRIQFANGSVWQKP